jgi:hypothetical protein
MVQFVHTEGDAYACWHTRGVRQAMRGHGGRSISLVLARPCHDIALQVCKAWYAQHAHPYCSSRLRDTGVRLWSDTVSSAPPTVTSGSQRWLPRCSSAADVASADSWSPPCRKSDRPSADGGCNQNLGSSQLEVQHMHSNTVREHGRHSRVTSLHRETSQESADHCASGCTERRRQPQVTYRCM